MDGLCIQAVYKCLVAEGGPDITGNVDEACKEPEKPLLEGTPIKDYSFQSCDAS